MLQIRHDVFETNSSSTHSITVCSKNDYDLWKSGKVYLNDGWWRKDNQSQYKDKTFVTHDEAIDIIECDGRDVEYNEDNYENFDKYIADVYNICSFDEYFANEYLEDFYASYTTETGETVVAFGLYGYDY